MGDGDKDKELMWALKTGDLDEVKSRLVTCEDVNRDLHKRKPLHIAADFGQIEVAEYLLCKGADVDAVDGHGLTPLSCAVYEGHTSCVKFLIERGAKKDQKGLEGQCLLEVAECDAMRALLK